MLSVKKSTSSLSFRGDAYVKRDSNLYHASDSINYSTINDYRRYLELVILKRSVYFIMEIKAIKAYRIEELQTSVKNSVINYHQFG